MFDQNKPAELIERFVGAEYIQHYPHVPDGKNGFIKYFEKMAGEYPDKKVHIKRSLAEGNYVVLHCFQEWPAEQNYASMDIFRFDED